MHGVVQKDTYRHRGRPRPRKSLFQSEFSFPVRLVARRMIHWRAKLVSMVSMVSQITVHPDASGRPQVLAMHERVIDRINTYQGVWWFARDEFRVGLMCPSSTPTVPVALPFLVTPRVRRLDAHI